LVLHLIWQIFKTFSKILFDEKKPKQVSNVCEKDYIMQNFVFQEMATSKKKN
jgi:hypothetical protein